MAKRFKLSDDSINSYGFRILTSGIDLEQFRKNPVMLYDHDDWKRLPIGRWENITVEGDGLYADAIFDLKDEFAAQISQKVEDGIINMVSVGIRAIEESSDPVYMIPGQIYPTITKSKLREASITPFGSNSNALALYDENGKIIELNDKTVASLFPKPETKSETPMKLVFNKLQLKDEATEQEAVSAIEALEARASEAEAKLSEYRQKEADARKAEAITLIDAAIADQRINASAKEALIKAFDADFEGQKVILASINKRQTAKEVVNNPAQPDEKLIKMSWDDADKAGLLPELKEKHPDVFSAKFKEKYGKDPK